MMDVNRNFQAILFLSNKHQVLWYSNPRHFFSDYIPLHFFSGSSVAKRRSDDSIVQV